MTAAGAEAADLQPEPRKEQKCSESMREEDTTAAIHGGFTRQMKGEGGGRPHSEQRKEGSGVHEEKRGNTRADDSLR